MARSCWLAAGFLIPLDAGCCSRSGGCAGEAGTSVLLGVDSWSGGGQYQVLDAGLELACFGLSCARSGACAWAGFGWAVPGACVGWLCGWLALLPVACVPWAD